MLSLSNDGLSFEDDILSRDDDKMTLDDDIYIGKAYMLTYKTQTMTYKPGDDLKCLEGGPQNPYDDLQNHDNNPLRDNPLSATWASNKKPRR
ncbi:hypothetical protein BaRGS_00004923 [Batillaria attramentaria]|uniref:Uncharacterized protein n=1 Tax=Batillaria attramentaria TaxID=370345 RepID=A0ABD0LWB1_9CAEN